MTLPSRQEHATTFVSTAPAATPRTLPQKLLDGLVTRTMRLPAPTTDYTMTRDLRIPTRDGVELLADMYTPTVAPVGHDPRPVAVRLSGADGRDDRNHVREPGLPRPPRPMPRHVRVGRRVRADDPRGRRRRRHGRVDARAAVVRRPLRHVRRLVPRVHAVGVARRSAARAGDRGDLHRSARLPRRGLPGWRVQPQRLPRLVESGRAARGLRLRARPARAGAGAASRRARDAGAPARRRRRRA